MRVAAGRRAAQGEVHHALSPDFGLVRICAGDDLAGKVVGAARMSNSQSLLPPSNRFIARFVVIGVPLPIIQWKLQGNGQPHELAIVKVFRITKGSIAVN
jgi:hypothetical protein